MVIIDLARLGLFVQGDVNMFPPTWVSEGVAVGDRGGVVVVEEGGGRGSRLGVWRQVVGVTRGGEGVTVTWGRWERAMGNPAIEDVERGIRQELGQYIYTNLLKGWL